MNFYIRQSFDSPVDGPFPPGTITSRIESGEITLDWLANPDLREPRSQVERSPKRDWVPIRSIHDLSGRWIKQSDAANADQTSKPNAARESQRKAIIVFIVILSLLMIVYAVIYAGCNERIN